MSTDSQILTILLDIKEQQGAFASQMMDAARSRARMEDGLKEVNAKVEKFEPVVTTVTEMKPQVVELMAFKNRAAGVVVVATFIVTAALSLIYAGLKEVGSSIGHAVGKAFS